MTPPPLTAVPTEMGSRILERMRDGETLHHMMRTTAGGYRWELHPSGEVVNGCSVQGLWRHHLIVVHGRIAVLA